MTNFAKQLGHIEKLLRNEQDPHKREAMRRVIRDTIIKLEGGEENGLHQSDESPAPPHPPT